MQSPLRPILAMMLASLMVSACASTGNTARQGVIRANLGTAPRNVLISETLDALTSRYGFLMLRQVIDTEDIRFETDWKAESSLPDERAAGYTHARTKITVTARPRNRSNSGAQNLAVTFLAETQVQAFGMDVWESPPPSDDREEFIDEIATHLRRAYQTTLR